MSYRPDRLSRFVREIVSDAIANRIADPRVDRFTSVTRVELSSDLTIANVHVSVMGSESEARKTMQGLTSARGMIQTRLARQLAIRRCPMIRFHLDIGIKQGIETIRQIDALQETAPETRTTDSPGPDPASDAEDAE